MIDKVGAIILHDKKMLVGRNWGKEVFFIPGGKREPGETDEQTLHREVKEELDVAVKKSKFYKEFNTRNYNDTADLRVRAYFTEVSGEPKPTSEVEELMWVGKDFEKKKQLLATALLVIIPSLIKDGLL